MDLISSLVGLNSLILLWWVEIGILNDKRKIIYISGYGPHM